MHRCRMKDRDRELFTLQYAHSLFLYHLIKRLSRPLWLLPLSIKCRDGSELLTYNIDRSSKMSCMLCYVFGFCVHVVKVLRQLIVRCSVVVVR